MDKQNKGFNPGRATYYMMILICACLIGAVLKITSSIIIPIVIAMLLTFVMFPIVRWLDKWRIPRIISTILVVTIIVAGLYVFGMVLYTTGTNIVGVADAYEGRVTEVYIWAGRLLDLPYDEYLSIWQNIWGQEGFRNIAQDIAFSLLNGFSSFAANALLVILFVVFFLLEANFIGEKLKTAFNERAERVTLIGEDLITQVTRYLTAKFFISLANGIIFAVAFYFIGLEFAILWGVLQFMMNFIPNLGSITAGIAISLFALIQFWPDPTPIILVVAVVLGVNMFLCNIFDPKIVGDRVGISPLMVLLSLIIWGWIWGFAGMVLAVPMMVIIKIICQNIPFMEPIAILMGSVKSVKAIQAEQAELAKQAIEIIIKEAEENEEDNTEAS